MAKKTAFDDLFSDDFGKLGLQRLEELNALAITLRENLKSSAQTLSAKNRGSNPSTAGGAKEIETTKKEVEALKKQSEELAKIQERLNKATGEAAKEQSAYNLELKRQNQINKENAILESEKSTQYEKNVVLLNRLSKQIMALGGTDKAPKELANEFNRLFGEVKNAEESVKRFQRNVGNYASATAELKALTQQLIALELAGQRDSAAFREMQMRAAELKDTISDTKQEIKNMASDTRTIDGMVGAVNLLASSYQVLEGVSALVGDNSEEWKETMIKLQAVMAVTNGLQEVQNLLQKESAAMMFLNNVRTKAMAAAQGVYAFATGGATAATNALRISLVALTGIGIVALLYGAVSALMDFGNETEDAALKNDVLNESLEKTETLLREYTEVLSMLDNKSGVANIALGELRASLSALEKQLEEFEAAPVMMIPISGETEEETMKRMSIIQKKAKDQLLKDIDTLEKAIEEKEKEIAKRRENIGVKRKKKEVAVKKETIKEVKREEIDYYDQQIKDIERANKQREIIDLEAAKNQEELNELNYENKKKLLQDEIAITEAYGKDSIDLKQELARLEREHDQAIEDSKNAKEEKKIAEEQANFERRKKFAQEALSYFEKISNEIADARQAAYSEDISQSQKREEQLQQLAQQGQLNAQQSIALEDKRQAELEAKREKSIKRQREQAIILAGIEAFISAARSGSTNPSGDASGEVNNLLSSLEGALGKIKAFEKGGRVEGGEQLVRINEKGEEFVVNHNAVNKYGDDMLKDINEGRFNPLDYVSTPSMSSIKYSEPIATAVVSELREVKEAIRTKPVPSWSVSEITRGVREDVREGNNLLRKHYERGNKLF